MKNLFIGISIIMVLNSCNNQNGNLATLVNTSWRLTSGSYDANFDGTCETPSPVAACSQDDYMTFISATQSHSSLLTPCNPGDPSAYLDDYTYDPNAGTLTFSFGGLPIECKIISMSQTSMELEFLNYINFNQKNRLILQAVSLSPTGTPVSRCSGGSVSNVTVDNQTFNIKAHFSQLKAQIIQGTPVTSLSFIAADGTGKQINIALYTTDQITCFTPGVYNAYSGVNPHNTQAVITYLESSTVRYVASSTGSGTFNITSCANGRISGSFSASVTLQGGASTKQISGTFTNVCISSN